MNGAGIVGRKPGFDPGPLRLEPKDFPDEAAYLAAQARAIRRWIVVLSGHANMGHVGSALSVVDLLAALYFKILRVDPARPRWEERDRFILSKGHAALAAYVTLAARGFFPERELWDYLTDGSRLLAHVTTGVPGIELSTGSLGHGLSVGAGMAFAARKARQSWRTFVVLSDGECNEGSTWEAAHAAGHMGLESLTAAVDYNNMQALGTAREVMNPEPFADKWRSFGWGVREIDGHDTAAVLTAFRDAPYEKGKPSVVLARTKLGKGVSVMEDKLEWHYLSPKPEHVALALKELA
jgi:transketolase